MKDSRRLDHNRRARPTLRLLREDLSDGWDQGSHALRAISECRWEHLQPLAELPHLILRKAVDSFGSSPEKDLQARTIACSRDLRLLELRVSQWRAGIWTDPNDGVRWVCAAGLAKGGHDDADDFYVQLKSILDGGNGQRLLPTDQDRRLLERETMAQLLTEWELSIQTKTLAALTDTSGSSTFEVAHPIRSTSMATVTITFDATDPDLEEFVVEMEMSGADQASQVAWTLIRRTLTSVSQPSQEWDRYGLTFSQMTPLGHRRRQAERLREANAVRELLAQEPGTVSHYGHRPHIAESAVDGTAIRALCGIYFVAVQDHEAKPVCPDCASKYEQLPQ